MRKIEFWQQKFVKKWFSWSITSNCAVAAVICVVAAAAAAIFILISHLKSLNELS